MGYIAPIPNYQYNQYAEREIKNNYDPYHIGPINRTNPATNAYPNDAFVMGSLQKKTIKKKRTTIKNIKNRKVIEETYSVLTGKGRNFNEIV